MSLSARIVNGVIRQFCDECDKDISNEQYGSMSFVYGPDYAPQFRVGKMLCLDCFKAAVGLTFKTLDKRSQWELDCLCSEFGKTKKKVI